MNLHRRLSKYCRATDFLCSCAAHRELQKRVKTTKNAPRTVTSPPGRSQRPSRRPPTPRVRPSQAPIKAPSQRPSRPDIAVYLNKLALPCTTEWIRIGVTAQVQQNSAVKSFTGYLISIVPPTNNTDTHGALAPPVRFSYTCELLNISQIISDIFF
ncbi:hypothetical protein E2C01_014201 [Portunus trituberculatus]|uniref:Uncharacterized protein n=1 Tax=Portunus trituberculatus TaxID=210409 RepID=A0A5B7DJ88_PORTR|nr:hypothetical protein [Portunus trituberculatus]